MVPAVEENSTNAERLCVSSCRLRAASAFGRPTAAKRATVCPSTTPSSSTPAVWNTAVTGWSSDASSAASASRSATSHAATVTLTPAAASSSRSSAAPGASRPRRLVNSRLSAPLRTSQRDTSAPSAPVPPVTSTVPEGRHATATPRDDRTRRRAKTPDARTATWSSSPTRRSTRWVSARWSEVSGRSTRPPQRCGCSSATTRPRPHSWACTGLASRSDRPVETAPRVTHHSGASTRASPSACTSASVPATAHASSHASSETTPEIEAPSETAPWSASVTAARSGASGSTRRTSTPRPVSSRTRSWTSAASACPVGTATSQVPDSTPEAAPVTGVQLTR